MQDQVLIEGLRVHTVIGVFEWERHIQQPLMFDLCLSVDARAAAASDDLADAVNYAAVAERISSETQRLQSRLLEHLASALIRMIFAEFALVSAVKLTVRKPSAVAMAQAVGLSMTRTRDDFCA